MKITTNATLIKKLMFYKGLTQYTLAEKAGVHYTYISLLIKGQKQPSATVAFKIANALDCEIKDIFTISEEKAATK